MLNVNRVTNESNTLRPLSKPFLLLSQVLFRVEIFDGWELAPNFKSPAVVDGQPSLPQTGPGSYEAYIEEAVRMLVHPTLNFSFSTLTNYFFIFHFFVSSCRRKIRS